MSVYTKMTVALGLAASVVAQSAASSASPPLGSVVNIFLLDTDPQPLVASYLGMSNSLTTLAVSCPPGTPDDQCGYPEPFTVTANPSTVSASATYDGITLNYGCTLTGTTTGSCSVTYIGAASDIATDEAAAGTATGISTTTTAGPLSAADITLFPITVTAGAPAGQDVVAATSTGDGAAGSTYAGDESDSAAQSTYGADESASTDTSPNSSGLSGGTSPSINSGNYSVTSDPNPIATYSAAGASSIMMAPGLLGAALLGLAAFL